jgi:hypothetical protein
MRDDEYRDDSNYDYGHDTEFNVDKFLKEITIDGPDLNSYVSGGARDYNKMGLIKNGLPIKKNKQG